MDRPLQRAWARCQRADRDGQRLGRDHAVRGWKIRDAALAVSVGALSQKRGWAHRRRQGGMEGARAVEHLRHARQLPSRGRQGEPAEGDQAAAEARSAGEVTNGELNAAAAQSAYRGCPRETPMDYPRYQPRHQRPKGAGAFFDWNVFVSGNGTAQLKSGRIDRRWNRSTL